MLLPPELSVTLAEAAPQAGTVDVDELDVNEVEEGDGLKAGVV